MMKTKIILFIINAYLITFLFFFCFLNINNLKAQKTLKFNKVILVSSNEETVPDGMIWKIETYMQSNAQNIQAYVADCNTAYSAHKVYINSKVYYLYKNAPSFWSSATHRYAPLTNMRFWLPEGSKLKTECSADFISVTEYIVIP